MVTGNALQLIATIPNEGALIVPNAEGTATQQMDLIVVSIAIQVATGFGHYGSTK